jgi:hypothetical protein
LSVTCKTHGCVALVEWPSYVAAQDNYNRLTSLEYKDNCWITVYIPPPEEPSVRYQSRVIFYNCDRA